MQLKELIPVITPLGDGYAIFVELDAHDNYWTVVLNNQAIVTFKQEDIKAARNYTYNRNLSHEEMMGIIR